MPRSEEERLCPCRGTRSENLPTQELPAQLLKCHSAHAGIVSKTCCSQGPSTTSGTSANNLTAHLSHPS